MKRWWEVCTEFIVRSRNWRHQFQLEMENKRRQLKEPYGGKSLSARWVLLTGFEKSHLPTACFTHYRRKKGNIMLPVCFLSAVWPQTPTTQATLYQRPDCWKRFLVLLVKDVIKPPGTYFNNWLQLSCRSSKFSSPFPATSVLVDFSCTLRWIQFESQQSVLQSKQVKRTSQDSINELIIWKMNR